MAPSRQRFGRIDPRNNPVGHLVQDAPEVLIGLACAVFGGSQVAKKLLNKKSKKSAFASGLVTSIVFGYLGYTATKKIKNYLE